MTREFPITEESLGRLCAYVFGRYPESAAELYLVQRGGEMRSKYGSSAQMLDQLRDYCSQFPQGLLRLQTDHPYGMVIMLWCHCTAETGCEIKCACDAARPKAVFVISLPTVGNKLSPHTQAPISAQAQQEMTLPQIDAETTVTE